jgi:hypothetical protein
MIAIEEEKLAKQALRKKPGIILYDNEKIDHTAWRTVLPSYTINPSNMKLNNASQFVFSKTNKPSGSVSTSVQQ